MKKMQISLAITAIVLATSAAFAGQQKVAKRGEVLWGQQQDGTWVETTLGATCTSAQQVCKEEFPSGQDPNDDPTGGMIVQNNGYIN